MKLAGVDEAGRGAWAGPIVAGAVLANDNFNIPQLTDSKKLTKNQRTRLLRLIQQTAIVGVGFVEANMIDRIGLTEANRLAMKIAVNQLGETYDRLLIDGNVEYLPGSEAIIGGDGKVPTISAASIVAKVFRDKYMYLMSQKHPDYGFENHVGYGAKSHRLAIDKLGISEIHRKSFKPISQIQLI